MKVVGDASPHLAELRGHIVLLDFWSPSFQSSRESLPDLANLVARHPDVRMLAITTAELPDLSATGAPAGVTFVRDPDHHIYDVYGAPGAMVVVIDKTGVIRAVDSLILHMDEIEKQITELEK